jgi:hypothetical protein
MWLVPFARRGCCWCANSERGRGSGSGLGVAVNDGRREPDGGRELGRERSWSTIQSVQHSSAACDALRQWRAGRRRS